LLRECLQQEGEGWLSEEDADDVSRLTKHFVWVVDPLDGTREFVDGIPEWSISVAAVVDGEPVAGGIENPASGEVFLGSLTDGVFRNGARCVASPRQALCGATILSSRQEYLRGEWSRYEGVGLSVSPVGSVAYKLALVAAGLADATFTLQPKNEWDVAAGVALVRAAGGRAECISGKPLRFNQSHTLLPGMLAAGPALWEQLWQLIH
jgi:myo-inositol-1(or 4)-monophosphatase